MTRRALTYWPAHTSPVPLDIVWCRWPFEDGGGFKDRPALVRTLKLYDNQTKLGVEVAYGTSKLKPGLREHDLVISNAEEMAAAGCAQNTRFDLDRCLWLPWCKEFFVCRDGDQTPIVGHLHARTIQQLEFVKTVRARMAALSRK